MSVSMSAGHSDEWILKPEIRPGDLALGDLRDHVGKPGLTINAVELESLDEREHDRGAQ
jgi:hypothetical protein